MDLIYADEKKIDQGVLLNYSLDMAYGSDENNFVCTMELGEKLCKQNYYLYIDGTEYGGIIDQIGADTNRNVMTYSGRTWHGVLASKVIEPNPDEDYYYANGEANHAILAILIKVNLYVAGLFTVSSRDSGIKINNYPLRYQDTYSGIQKMLASVNAKLKMTWKTDHIELEAVLLNNYSAMEEFDSSQLMFKANQVFNKVNHLICLGAGDLKDRYVIHLFCDTNGGIQDYLKDMNKPPLKDRDYILTRAKRVLSGLSENVGIYDYPNAQTAENYEILNEKPNEWDESYSDFYEKSEIGYQKLERNIQDVYVLLTSQPANWGATYRNYYTRIWNSTTNEYEYAQVDGDLTERYERVTAEPASWQTVFSNYYKKNDNNEYVPVERIEKYRAIDGYPGDWDTNYMDYYYSDGINYRTISGVSETTYDLQTIQPSDWATSWGDTYVLFKQYDAGPGGYTTTYIQARQYYARNAASGTAPKWQTNTFYNMGAKLVAPDRSDIGTIYYKYMDVPGFSEQEVYFKTTTFGKTWQTNTFYEKQEDQDLGIEFVENVYYRQVFDHYADLVAGGIERLTELNNVDTLDVKLEETQQEYDIGDIVGARENVTGIFVTQKVSKKIIKIERDVVTIRYEVS